MRFLLTSALILLSLVAKADPTRYINSVWFKAEGGYMRQNADFFRGDNIMGRTIDKSAALHIKYSFQAPKGSWTDAVYGSVYQGIGVGANTFFNTTEIGNPISVYVFQGAKIVQLSPVLSLNYEWNLGASFGWKTYHEKFNPKNNAIGSKVNAYIGANLLLEWALTNNIDFIAGVGFSHFSNGNTKTPNKGINIFSAIAQIRYNINRDYRKYQKPAIDIAKFPKHLSCDITLFGASKRKGIITKDIEDEVESAEKRFGVIGVSFAGMYALGYKIKTGISLDLTYDQSAGTAYSVANGLVSYKYPPVENQISAGLSARVDYVMPYFTISGQLGYNIVNPQKKSEAFYQTISLKYNVLKNIYLTVGYSTINFAKANYLMMGAGFRFR